MKTQLTAEKVLSEVLDMAINGPFTYREKMIDLIKQYRLDGIYADRARYFDTHFGKGSRIKPFPEEIDTP